MKQILRLLHGDCLVRLEEIKANTISAAIFDPPYHISFMSKSWDQKWDGTGVAFSPELWNTVFEVLDPGGVVKAFGGTRTFHRMAAAMEDVGLIDITFDAWGYGCLSEDTEILTERGWKPGLEAQIGERVACWDSATGEIRLDVVEEVTLAPFKGEMVAFQNDNTDQLLTPNHRVYKKSRIRKMEGGVRRTSYEDNWTTQQAGLINRWNHLNLPLSGFQHGPGIRGPRKGTDLAALLAWVWTEGGFDHPPSTGVRLYQSSVNQEHVNTIQALLDKLVPGHKHYPRVRSYKGRPYTEHTWFFTGPMAQWIRNTLPCKRPTWDLLWAMTQEEKHAFVDAAVAGDGSIGKGRMRKDGTRGPGRIAFYQKNPDDLIWFQTLAHLMGRQGRINFQKHAVGLHMNPTTQFQGRHLKAKTNERYEGDVWCVRVSTGAFLARRGDKIFITGNSGFPKSLDVSKALDKMNGATRAMVRTPYTGNALLRSGGQNTRPWMEEALKKGYHEAPGKEPVSDDAKEWAGWGTALKPAWEPILIGTKPGGSPLVQIA